MTTFEMVRLGMMIAAATSGVVFAMVKWIFRLERAQLAGKSAENEKKLASIEHEVRQITHTLSERYVRRDDWVPQVAAMQSRMERLSCDLHELIGEIRSMHRSVQKGK